MQVEQTEIIIGAKIKQLRKLADLKLEELARAATISPSLLSKIENAKVSSPLSTYSRIAKALNVNFGDLVNGQPGLTCLIVRKEETDLSVLPSHCDDVSADSHNYRFKALGTRWPNHNFKPFILTYLPQPEGENENPQNSNTGEEFFYVLKGKVDFFHGNEKYLLNEGDCIFIDGSIPHGGRAHGKEKAEVLYLYIKKI